MGPVAASSEGRTSYGDELRVRKGVGSSDGGGLTTFDAGASVRVTKRTQSMTGDLGPTFSRWLGPTLLSFSPATGLGFERYAGKAFVDAALHGALTGGFVLDEATTTERPWQFMFGEPVLYEVEPGVGPPSKLEPHVTVRRRRTVLTLELRGGLEPRFTREPLWTAALLVGLTSVSEVFNVRRPR